MVRILVELTIEQKTMIEYFAIGNSAPLPCSGNDLVLCYDEGDSCSSGLSSMTFDFVCPYCHSRTRVDDRFAGQSGPCAECGKPVTMPSKRGASAVSSESTKRRSSRSRNEAWPAKLLGAFLTLLFIGCLATFIAMVFFPSAKNALGVRQRALGMSNAKQIADALNSYRVTYGSYPTPTVVDAAGKPLYSWRVLILPQLGYDSLYNAYQLDQSWDSPTNLNLMAQMPPVYACPGNINALAVQETNFSLIIGPGTLFPPGKPVNPDQMLDKASETLLVVETTDGAFTWTQPGDISSSNGIAIGKRSMVDVGGNYPDCFIAATVDGSPVAIKDTIPRASLDSMVSPNGEETVDIATMVMP
jgi:Protein of unknown function (DUF1559)